MPVRDVGECVVYLPSEVLQTGGWPARSSSAGAAVVAVGTLEEQASLKETT